jgi:hypothetical protein
MLRSGGTAEINDRRLLKTWRDVCTSEKASGQRPWKNGLTAAW